MRQKPASPRGAEKRAPSQELREILANNTRRAREALKLSQRQFAHTVGIGQKLMSLIETAHANPSLDTVYVVAAGLGVPVHKLLKPSRPVSAR